MVWGFRQDPEPVDTDNKADDDGKGDGKLKPNERQDVLRKHGADAVHDGKHENPPRR